MPAPVRIGLWLAAVLATPALTLVLIARHGVNVPVYDDWSLVPLFAERDAGTLSVRDLLRQHYEHVPVFPRAADFFMAPLTRWDLRAEMYRNFAFALATFGLVLVALRRTLDRTPFLVAAVVGSLLFFSPSQAENWLWGWQLEWFLSNLGAIGAFYVLAYGMERSPRRGLALAVLGAVVATFSLGQGLLVWPVGLVILLLRRRAWRAWTATAVTAYVLYFFDWQNPELGSKSRFLRMPVETADFLLLYLGQALARGETLARIAGLVVLGAFAAGAAAVLRRRDDEALVQRAAPWLALGLYALGAGVSTAVARVSEDVTVPGRYNVMGALLALATMALLYVVLERRVLPAVAVPLLAGGLLGASAGAEAAAVRGNSLRAFAACTRVAATPDAPCTRPAPGGGPEFIRALQRVHWPQIQYLRRKGWAGY